MPPSFPIATPMTFACGEPSDFSFLCFAMQSQLSRLTGAKPQYPRLNSATRLRWLFGRAPENSRTARRTQASCPASRYGLMSPSGS
jgi:hypothetical protein